MLNILEYKKFYLAEQSYYQFFWLDTSLRIQASCHSIFNSSQYIGEPITAIFPFVDGLQDNILEQEQLFLPCIDISDLDLAIDSSGSIFDFLFFVEKRIREKPIMLIVKDVSQCSKNLLEMQQITRFTMLENEYLALQNKNVQLENMLLQMQNQELQNSKKLKNLFFSKISHELRSPVNGILGLSQIILEEEDYQNEKIRSYIEGIYTSAKHLRVILDDILDTSKLESGNIEFQKNPFELTELFRHLKINFLKFLEQKNLSIHFYCSPDVPQVLVGDEVRLNQIFYNLISNAIKFTDKGEITVTADLLESHPKDKKCRVRFSVSDTGRGISPEELATIFEPYKQVGNFSYQALGSTGLGLSVVKQLVEMQGGSVQVSSEVMKGTTFVVELPFGFLEVRDFEGQVCKFKYAGLSALVVDDSKINRVYTEKILQNLGFWVETCQTGQEALEMLQEKYYDLLVTDIHIGEAEGNVLVETFERQNPHPQKTAVIFATGSVENQRFQHPTVLKPYSSKELLNLLEEVIPEEKTHLYSLEYLLKITEGKTEFINDMINSLLNNCPEEIAKVSAYIAQKNSEQLYKVIHKMKPMAVLMGSQVLARILLIIENKLKETQTDWLSIEKYGSFAEEIVQLACLFFEKQKNEHR